MHENLSSTISVKPGNNQYSIDKEGNDHWQCIASGKRFDSFFVLYAKIRGNFIGEKKDKRFQPTECDFYLQTFEGNLTIGLTIKDKTKIPLKLMYHVLLKQFVYILPIELEVLNNNIFVKQNSLSIDASSSYDCLSEKGMGKVNVLKKGIPENGKIVVDMTFSDMKQIEVVNRGVKQKAFEDRIPDSPIINGDKFVREGSQLFKRKYEMHNPPEYKYVYEDENLNPGCNNEIKKKIEEAIRTNWASPITIDNKQGLIYGLGCHPYICKVVF